MTCVHLRKLYDLCQSNDIRIASLDLVHVVCNQCGQKEVCPSMLLEEYEWSEAGMPASPPPLPVAKGGQK
jgi:hypothetical protein